MDWNNDGKNDLLVGNGIGEVTIFLNTNNNTNPVLDNGSFIQVNGINLDIGNRAAPVVDDWNGDGKKDLIIGGFNGRINIYLNEGTDSSPVFNSSAKLQVGGAEYIVGVNSSRAAPRIYDWNQDGKKDLLVGDYYGYVYYLQNVGTNNAPVFNTSEKLLLLDSTPLRYLDSEYGNTPRSRLDVTDWNDDGYADLIVGGGNGKLMVFTAAPEPASLILFIIGSGILGLSKLRKKFMLTDN
ncbi:MAG: PEP-CTERM sorting domain-containing protein [Nitrospiraceae bacterium]|nr:MAG: PEP-CTERM sorting domain-containing protein [Nitrospiraceae bacterium]